MIYILHRDSSNNDVFYEAPEYAGHREMVKMPDGRLAKILPIHIKRDGVERKIWLISRFLEEIPEAKLYTSPERRAIK